MNAKHFYAIKKKVTYYLPLLQVCECSKRFLELSSFLFFLSTLKFVVGLGLDPILFAISIDRQDLNNKFCGIPDTVNNEQIIFTTPAGKCCALFCFVSNFTGYLFMYACEFFRRHESERCT